jgi:hypothetical protein
MRLRSARSINAVFYFSTRILRAVVPANAEYISLFLAFANFVLGLAPVFLIEVGFSATFEPGH